MKNIQQDMNVARQRRKLTSLLDHVCDPDPGDLRYLAWLVELFDDAVAHGLPQPATEFIPMYHEEFGL